MNISGTTQVFVSLRGTIRATRVCGRVFNAALRASRDLVEPLTVKDGSGDVIVPSKSLTWQDVASQVRAGKKVQASAGARKRSKSRDHAVE